MTSNKESEELPLRLPEEINYECTGCGKCCSGWSVPLTEEDYQRIAARDWGNLNEDLANRELFRSLRSSEKQNTPYTHAIMPTDQGQCPFLKNNLCFIHSQFGAEEKPAICQLFPYSFNETPDGVYATVSFISRGAIFNSGRALSEQKDYLQAKYKEFRRLFPDHHPNWSQVRLSANVPLQWAEYLEIEGEILKLVQDKNKNLESRFIEVSIYLNSLLGTRVLNHNRPSEPDNKQQALNNWDKILLSTLYKTYFPNMGHKTKSYGQQNLALGNFLIPSIQIISAKQKLDSYLFNDLIKLPWDEDIQINDLIYRFFYSHIFAKLYFGAGFGQLSVVAGFHHLCMLLALIKLKAKVLCKQRNGEKVQQVDIVDAIVQLEKSLGEVKISPYGAAILELLLSSPQRVERLLYCQA